MLKRKPKCEAYNSGVLFICKEPETKSSFGASITPTKKEDLTVEEKYDFKEMSKREEDISFAESRDKYLSLKVKVPYRHEIRTSKQVLIGDVLYSIIKTDTSAGKSELYLYLAEMRQVK